MRLFRDDASLTATPGLWSAIEAALSRSSWFVLLASPEAAASRGVEREVTWWLRHRSVDKLLLVLTDGELRWNDSGGDFDREHSTAVPSALYGAFTEEPLWVDARWSRTATTFSARDAEMEKTIVDVAARIRDLPKETLYGIAAREHRRTMRLALAARQHQPR